MAFEATDKTDSKGSSQARIVCDDCEKGELIPCAYVGGARSTIRGGAKKLNENQARSKAIAMGWAYVKNKLRCPTCEEKRKVVPMKKVEPETPKEPSRDQKREIMGMLKDCYDTDAERYTSGDTDETLAEVLGVMPGWVAKLREEFFGPAGGNENMDDLIERLEALEHDIGVTLRNTADLEKQAKAKLAEVSAMKADLDRIKKAVGPRVCKQAKVGT